MLTCLKHRQHKNREALTLNSDELSSELSSSKSIDIDILHRYIDRLDRLFQYSQFRTLQKSDQNIFGYFYLSKLSKLSRMSDDIDFSRQVFRRIDMSKGVLPCLKQ